MICRYLNEQAPPPGFCTPGGLAHYVSLLPSRIDSGLDDSVTLTSKQVLDVMCANDKERAVLLTNYFLHLGKIEPDKRAEVLLLNGSTFLDKNRVTWVLRRCNEKVVLWDATAGIGYDQDDECCPLKSVHFLASKSNIFGNIQRSHKLSSLSFDTCNRQQWAVFFPNGKERFTKVTHPVQEIIK